jgi:phosphatidylserine synthase
VSPVVRAPVHDLHASNLLTYGSIAAALGAIAASRGAGHLSLSGALLALAVIFDTFDGGFARRFARDDRQRQIGGQIDSLVDAVVFGLTPIVVLAGLPDSPAAAAAGWWWWWSAAFIYLLSAVTRLGAFTVDADETRFVAPAPAMALIWSTVPLVRRRPGRWPRHRLRSVDDRPDSDLAREAWDWRCSRLASARRRARLAHPSPELRDERISCKI